MNNTNTPQFNKVTKDVLEKIRTGEVEMRPKIYFLLKIIMLQLIVILTLTLSSLLLSLIIFHIYVSGKLFLLGFGLQGLFIFFMTFPWALLLADALLLLLLERLLKRFRFGYRSPLVYIVCGTLIINVGIGIAIYISPLHTNLLHRAQQKNLPIIGDYYRDMHRSPHEQGLYRGTIITLNQNDFVMRGDVESGNEEGLVRVTVTTQMNITSFLEVGDSIFVAGVIDGSEIRAYGIKKIEINTTAQ